MNARPKSLARILLSFSFCFAVATLAAAADPLVHTVQKGETLYAIARKYDVSVEELKKANSIADEARLLVGLKLTIPSSRPEGTAPAFVAIPAPAATVDYTVVKGDTLYGIAKAHGVTVDAIVKATGMKSTVIKIGQKLKVPVAAAAAPSAGTTATGAATTGASTTGAATTGSTGTGPKPAPSTTPAAKPVSLSKAWPANGSVSYLQGKLKGVTIATDPGSPILAIRAGTVVSAGPFRGFDLVAFVQCADGLVYVYGGAGSLSVRVGDSVRKGSLIGKVVSDREPAAYFFVFKGADTVDPNSVPRD
jgi:LysM repeat protein